MTDEIPATLRLDAAALEQLAARVTELLPVNEPPAQEWLTAKDAATHLTLSVSTIRRLTASGQIPHYDHGTRVVYNRGELNDWFRQNASSGG